MKNYHKFQSLFSLLFLFISISSFSSDLDIKSNTIIFEVSKVEFERVLEVIEKKYNRRGQKVKNSFTISIGKIDVIFNTSNV